VHLTPSRGDYESSFALRMGPFRRKRWLAHLRRTALVAAWSAGLLAVAAIAGLALAGLQSGL